MSDIDRSIISLLRHAGQVLTHDTAGLDAEILLAFVLGKPRSFLYAWPDKVLGQELVACFYNLLEKRLIGWPIAYLTKECEFWSMKFQVTPDTLIPRSETEHLLEQILDRLPTDDGSELLELGTGSGILAVALGVLRPKCQIIAVDISWQCLQVAMLNASRHQVQNVQFVLSDWFSALAPKAYQIVFANPPYLAYGDEHLFQGDVRFEPDLSLLAGPDGMHCLEQIITDANRYLVRTGYLLVEHGYQQGAAVRHAFLKNGYQGVQTCHDDAGHERISVGQYISI